MEVAVIPSVHLSDGTLDPVRHEPQPSLGHYQNADHLGHLKYRTKTHYLGPTDKWQEF